MQICSFLWVYYGFPTSEYEGRNVEEVRYRCGAALAKRDDVDADFVCGVPDSGIGHAFGYANEKRMPYMSSFSKVYSHMATQFHAAEADTARSCGKNEAYSE